MLSSEKFLEMIGIVSAYYTTFKFELLDSNGNMSLMSDVWYEAFSKFSDEDFEFMIKQYCQGNVYAPSNPTQILEFTKTKLIGVRSEEINKSWQDLLNMIAINGNSEYLTLDYKTGKNVWVNPLKQALENHDNKLLNKIYLRMSSMLLSMTDYNRMDVLKEFQKQYAELISQDVVQKLEQGTANQNLMIENKKKER